MVCLLGGGRSDHEELAGRFWSTLRIFRCPDLHSRIMQLSTAELNAEVTSSWFPITGKHREVQNVSSPRLTRTGNTPHLYDSSF